MVDRNGTLVGFSAGVALIPFRIARPGPLAKGYACRNGYVRPAASAQAQSNALMQSGLLWGRMGSLAVVREESTDPAAAVSCLQRTV